MNCIGTYDGTIFYNPANKFCIVSVKTADQSVPAEARSNRRYKDHLIRFTAVGYEIPRTDAVELELDGDCLLYTSHRDGALPQAPDRGWYGSCI